MRAHSKIARNTAFLYVRMLIVMGTSLYTVRIVLSALGVQDFGIYTVAAAVIGLLTFLNGTMSQAAQRFLSIDIGKNDSAALRKTFNATLGAHIIIAIFVIIAGETLGAWLLNHKLAIPPARMSAANDALHFSVAAAAMLVLQTPFSALIIAREKMWFFSLVSLLEALLKLGIAFLVSHSSLDRLTLYAALVLVAGVLTGLTYAVFCLRAFSEARLQLHRDSEVYLKLFSFTGWSFIGSLSSACRNQGSNILLNLFFGTIANASHGVMSHAQTAATTFMNSFQMALSPQIYQCYARRELAQMRSLVFLGSKLNFVLLIIIIAPVMHCMTFLLNAWLQHPPTHAHIFVKLILVMLLSEAVSQPLMTAAAATGNIKWYQIIVGGTILLNLPLSYVAYTKGAPPEAFLYIAICITLVTLAQRVFFLRSMIGMRAIKFATKVLVPLLLTTAAVAGLLLALDMLGLEPRSPLQMFIIGPAVAIGTAAICLALAVSSSERRQLAGIVLAKLPRRK